MSANGRLSAPTWLITGCSTGFGRAIAEAVLAAGQRAVVTARTAQSLASLAAQYPDTALPLALDVTDPDSVSAAVTQAEQRFGGIDVLVNNAGHGYRAAVEEGEREAVRELFETNFFGTVAMIQAVLPGMRASRSGTIVNISSIGARITPAGSGYYSATKAAVEGLSGSLAKEVEPLGIRVIVIEPGAFRTDFAGRSLTQAEVPIADYAETAGKRRKEYDRSDGAQPGDPTKGAAVILDTVASADPPRLLLLGHDALQGFDAVASGQRDDVAAWSAVSASTDFDR